MTKLAGFSFVLFSLFVCTCVCFSCLTDSLIDSLCVLIPVLPESLVVLFHPFQNSLLSPSFSLPVFLPLSVMQRLIHIYIHTQIQSHPHIHV